MTWLDCRWCAVASLPTSPQASTATGLEYFARVLDADAVDCLQVDVTRCGGVTAPYRIGALAQARHVQVSGHCAPCQHAAVLAAPPNLRHLEYFHDHARIERMLFDGARPVVDGSLTLAQAPGHGLALRQDAAQRYQVDDR